MRVAFVITPNMLATSLTNAYELFFAANQATRRSATGIESKTAKLVKVGLSDERLELPSGLSLRPDVGLSREVFDMVYLPALWRNPRPIVRSNMALVRHIAQTGFG